MVPTVDLDRWIDLPLDHPFIQGVLTHGID